MARSKTDPEAYEAIEAHCVEVEIEGVKTPLIFRAGDRVPAGHPAIAATPWWRPVGSVEVKGR